MPKFQTITVPLPVEMFDVDGATAERRRRVSVQRVNDLHAIRKASGDESDLYAALADIWPRWDGVIDVDTGEPLPNPEDDPGVFRRIDMGDQLGWLVGRGCAYSPNRSRGS